MDRTIAIAGDPNIGVFARVFEDIAVLPPEAPPVFIQRITEVFDVEPVVTSLQGSSLIGPLLCGNREGARSKRLHLRGREEGPRRPLRPFSPVRGDECCGKRDPCQQLLRGYPPGDASLAGIRSESVPRGTIGATHVRRDRDSWHGRGGDRPRRCYQSESTPQEIAALQALTDLPIGKGSVNMGSGLVGAGLLANNRGYLAGLETSGYELGRIEDIFGFLE